MTMDLIDLMGQQQWEGLQQWDGHRWYIVPRRAVAGDIGDWAECQAWKFAHGDVWSPALKPKPKPKPYAPYVHPYVIAELERRLKMYEPVNQYNGLSIEEWRTAALKAESEARSLKTLCATYSHLATRRRKIIEELHGQANELRAQLERVRQALGVGQNLQNLAP